MAIRAPAEVPYDYDYYPDELAPRPEVVVRHVDGNRVGTVVKAAGAATVAAGLYFVGQHFGHEGVVTDVAAISQEVGASLNGVGTPPVVERFTTSVVPGVTNIATEAYRLGVTPAALIRDNPGLTDNDIRAGKRIAYTQLKSVSAKDQKLRQDHFVANITNPKLTRAQATAVPKKEFSDLSALTVIFTRDTAHQDYITQVLTLPDGTKEYATYGGFIVKANQIALAYTLTAEQPAAPAAAGGSAARSARGQTVQPGSGPSVKSHNTAPTASHERAVRSQIVNSILSLYRKYPNQSPFSGGKAWTGLRSYINAWRGTPADSRQWLPYCSLGVSYFYAQAGYPLSGGPNSNPSALALVEDIPSQGLTAPVTLQSWFQQNGHYWRNQRGGEMPEAGDVLFLSPNGDGTLTHTAVVVQVQGDTITYVAADDSSSLTVNMDKVSRNNTSYVVAFGSPFPTGKPSTSLESSPRVPEKLTSKLTDRNLKAFMLSALGQESMINWTTPPNASDASGGFQVIGHLWNNYGGYSAAYLAPPEVQYKFAKARYTYYYNLYFSDPQKYSANGQFDVWRFMSAAWYAGPGFETEPGLDVYQTLYNGPSVMEYAVQVESGDSNSYHPSMTDYLNGHPIPRVPGLPRSVYDPNY